MTSDEKDYYEILQISPNADPDTITRVFRLLAQRYHPDHPVTGNDERFRGILNAYTVLNDPVERARYDVTHEALRRNRWQFAASAAQDGQGPAEEQQLRFHLLDVLYARRRQEPHRPGLSMLDLSELLGCPLEHLEFATWYLVQRQFVTRNDQSQLAITASGVDALEERRLSTTRPQPLRLPATIAEARTA